jgi:GntR family transcriptional regulator, transcriptional repressor for pyruvate dehydrogenase complex
LAEYVGVSRLTLREAVKILQAKHVLEVRHGHGTFVKPVAEWSPFDPELLAVKSRSSDGAGALPEKLVEARRLIEVGAAQMAAARRTEADLKAMCATLERMKQAGDDIDAFAAADIDFHQAVLAAVGNAFIVAMFEPFSRLILAARRQTKSRAEIRAHALVAHQRILDAIRDRDPEAARWAMHDHLTQTREDLAAYADFLEEQYLGRLSDRQASVDPDEADAPDHLSDPVPPGVSFESVFDAGEGNSWPSNRSAR